MRMGLLYGVRNTLTCSEVSCVPLFALAIIPVTVVPIALAVQGTDFVRKVTIPELHTVQQSQNLFNTFALLFRFILYVLAPLPY
jgi:hypothetical protein